MTLRPWMNLIVLLLAHPIVAAEDVKRTVAGRVVDAAGRPIEGASVSAFWGANGLDWDQVVAVRENESEKLWRDEGKMEPWGDVRARTDDDGRFSISTSERSSLMILDRERRRGAMLGRTKPGETVVVRLQPLVRIFGTTRLEGQPRPMKWACTYLNLPYDEADPLKFRRMAICGSFRSEFVFLVPPGAYEISAFSDDPKSRTIEGQKITVTPNQEEINPGALVLTPETDIGIDDRIKQSKARGTWGNFNQLVGKTPPDWHLTDAKGIAKDARIADFRGKWVVLYFWGPDCAPCLGKDLPELMAFYEAHATQRDRFEILAFCCDFQEKLMSIEDLEKKLEPVKRAVWGGKDLPFPVLLDNTFQTYERYGREGTGVPVYALINPEGKLVVGELDVLAKELDRPEQLGR